jgi:AbiV family abortive infection protein
MPVKNRDYKLTLALLGQFRDASLLNADSLLEEAALLSAHQHHARAYFLSVSSIEEAGKAVQAFEGLGRNLQDCAVEQKLKLQFESHSEKMTAAFLPWLRATANVREVLTDREELMATLKFGREASMYTDINAERAMVTTPQMQISPESAASCVRLARNVLSHVMPYAQQPQPAEATTVQDAFFVLKPATFRKIFNEADFWEYYLLQREQENTTFEDAVTEYKRCYLDQGKVFDIASPLVRSRPSSDVQAQSPECKARRLASRK